MGRRSFSLISQKGRNRAAFRTTGKRYEPPGCVGRYQAFLRLQSSGQREMGSVRRSKISAQIIENELCAAACYSKYGKYSFGSVTLDYS